MNANQLSRIVLRGYKSIRECDLELRSLNVLIGPNGAGKSNFISFFKMIQHILSGRLQYYVGKTGGPDAQLHFGKKKTEHLSAELFFGDHGYKFSLEPTQDNRMMFTSEAFWWQISGHVYLGSGHFESRAELDHTRVKEYALPAMKSWRVYHFHDTSDTAFVKGVQQINDTDYLRPDARNLAPFLLRLRNQHPASYERIRSVVQLIAPFFGDFYLKPTTENPDTIELQWTERGEDIPFKAYQLSDGTLRFICLATVLCQPLALQPDTILIDEPELGLHPRAIGYLASMLKAAAVEKQIIISTQSVTLVNCFEAEDLIIVEREEGSSVFRRLDPADFCDWLLEYTLGDLWEKNLIGGRG